eukprot:CAMPEP_0197840406 /NCGR_PEP_ID=MMETSP1437-20131217/45590_1 /TAXON_ID=49252 ORGANISM="Eucampia antarctica, Strain CCMP1452" /NCGR_SAMPLE_ID=MMETSP1437 /ASSEMBLY_ACC=CAM_ASM_001096 /LENGTH=170 /DNA_ID=CAMNT_0043450015 /DNA_START=812 /DNA_END=1324 /DNA_ORIENTATION=+
MSILKDPPPSTIPSLQEGDTTATSIQQIADLLHRHAPKNEKSFLHHSLSQRFFQHRVFDFNKTPLAPPGTKVLLHENTQNRGSWSPHGTEGWYIGPSLEHYRCVKSFIPNTYSKRDCDTVEFFPSKIVFSSMSTDNYLHQCLKDILSILKDPPPLTIPSLQAGDNTVTAV